MCVVISVASADAAILFLKGSDEPLHVRTIRENETSILVGVPQADGSLDERLIERRMIDQWIPTVSSERLAALDPDKPAMYRDYAEELAEKKIDPDARAAAIRLYLIAAYLEPDNLGRSSLLGMTSLARSPGEERRIRAMAYLLDPKHDRSVLKSASSVREGPDENADRQALIDAVRLLRQGKHRVAERIARRPGVAAAFARYGRTFSREEFLDACNAPAAIDNTTLARLIHFELQLTGAKTGGSDSGEADAAPSWSATLESGNVDPVPALTLQTLTEFDPEKCVYRDGKWVQPQP